MVVSPPLGLSSKFPYYWVLVELYIISWNVLVMIFFFFCFSLPEEFVKQMAMATIEGREAHGEYVRNSKANIYRHGKFLHFIYRNCHNGQLYIERQENF